MFPSGKYWNHMDVESDGTDYLMVTDIPCNHTENGEAYCNLYNGMSDDAYVYKDTSTQCWGFASYLSDYIFGSDAAAKRFIITIVSELETRQGFRVIHIRYLYSKKQMIM